MCVWVEEGRGGLEGGAGGGEPRKECAEEVEVGDEGERRRREVEDYRERTRQEKVV